MDQIQVSTEINFHGTKNPDKCKNQFFIIKFNKYAQNEYLSAKFNKYTRNV
jgi:hypothetical protein